ncbi:amidohydrolase family protein [Planktotalea sp.]|uniref:amidohydrolase family protein n=1 Tax=Planktotalea sp. TaxID=2029877 RepID=UPI0025D279E1|nr:amidohydrolase family protein [Planktotalea sp.]
MNFIDAHHHLWDLKAVDYPWLNAKDVSRFFGNPAPIQRDYLLNEFSTDAGAHGFTRSVHIQVGAADAWEEAKWVQSVADHNPDWPLAQVVFCDLTAPDLDAQLDRFQTLSTVRGVRQIIGRAPGEDAQSGTNDLLQSSAFLEGLKLVGQRGLSFDLQLIPDLMPEMSKIAAKANGTKIALCHAGSPHDRSPSGLSAYAHALRALSDLPNVTCKLSGLGMFDHSWTSDTIRPIIELCLEQFGAKRCMFGSNFPVDMLYSSYETLVRSYFDIIPKAMRQGVFSNVAEDFYFT